MNLRSFSLLGFLLLFLVSFVSSNKNDCFWTGTAPFCVTECPTNFRAIRKNSQGNGHKCWTGLKTYCCPGRELFAAVESDLPSNITIGKEAKDCYWSGTAPFCHTGCQDGYLTVITDKKGDGHTCWTGVKNYCCLKKAAGDIVKSAAYSVARNWIQSLKSYKRSKRSHPHAKRSVTLERV